VVIVTPLAILLIGLGAAGWYAWHHFKKLIEESGRGPSTPGFTVEIKEAGKHTLWLHTHTTLEQETPTSDPPRLPGQAHVLIQNPDGADVPLTSAVMHSTKTTGSDTAVSLGTFEAFTPGNYHVEVKGGGDSRLLSVAPVKVGRVMGYAITLVGTCAGSFVTALGALFILLRRRARALRIQQGG